MNKYELYYKDILIANITIIENQIIEYKVLNPINDIFNFLKKDFSGMLVDFPFIKSRIDNMNKFNLEQLKYENNSYLLKRI